MSHTLKKIRQQNGLTIDDLHSMSGVSRSAIRRIESGASAHKINDATAKLLADAFRLEVSDIFSPNELSHAVGRPPLTGGAYAKSSGCEPDVCPGCSVTLPMTRVCDDCGVVPRVQAR